MAYFMLMFGFCFVFWMIGVSSSPSPYFGVICLIFGALCGCGLLVSMGGSFVSLVLFLIYLGGMLVIFAYSSALMAGPFPVGRLTLVGVFNVLFSFFVIAGFAKMGCEYYGLKGIDITVVDDYGLCVVRLDFSGVSCFYYLGWELLLIAGWGLLLTLFAVLELVSGLIRLVLRAI
uniref:NADH-ubiquinone oxidoreductase chain 6 n=1 Tax=Heosemys annandalii TaxID=260624 RepID=I6LV74_9SAUR|nr:NADH dehydrogenase subunit 6 [Heosemys annandalii]AEE60113.1 NADH dehydrogenase subunit 6 [Heosemys annandalii]